MKYCLFSPEQALGLMTVGAIVLDQLDTFQTEFGEVIGAPVYMNRAQIGIVGEGFLDHLEDRALPTIRKYLIGMPEMRLAYYWIHSSNEAATLFEVEVSYVQPQVQHVPVITSIAEEQEATEEDEDEPDEGRTTLRQALGLIDEDDEDTEDEETDEEDEEGDEDEDGEEEEESEG